jgi:hypothetical protein
LTKIITWRLIHQVSLPASLLSLEDDDGETDGDDPGACGRKSSDGGCGDDKGGKEIVIHEQETETRG